MRHPVAMRAGWHVQDLSFPGMPSLVMTPGILMLDAGRRFRALEQICKAAKLDVVILRRLADVVDLMALRQLERN